MSLARTRGFTLVELMITVAVAAILAAIAWPSFRDFMRRNAVTAQANQVLASLQYARNEAVSRRYPTALCGSSSGTSCDGGSTLENGWMVWRDSSLSGTPSYSAGSDELLRVTQAQNGVSIRAFLGGVGANLVSFNQRGEVSNAGGAVTNIVICAKTKSTDTVGTSTSAAQGQYVRIDSSGRITVQSLSAGASCSAAPT